MRRAEDDRQRRQAEGREDRRPREEAPLQREVGEARRRPPRRPVPPGEQHHPGQAGDEAQHQQRPRHAWCGNGILTTHRLHLLCRDGYYDRPA
jgi:hypothetical protein